MVTKHLYVATFLILSAAATADGLIFDDPDPCYLRNVNSFIAGPLCSVGNFTATEGLTVNFHNSRIGSAMRVCFSEIHDCSYTFSSSCPKYILPPDYLIFTDTTGGGKQQLTESNDEKCTQYHTGAGVSVSFTKRAIPYRDVPLRYRVL